MKKLPMKWYCLQVRPGQEKQVRREIARQAIIRDVKRFFGKVLIPRKRQIVLKKSANGERRVEERRKRFSGYLIVNVSLNHPEVWRILNGTLGSLGLMPERTNPNPLSDEDINKMIDEERSEKKEHVKVKTGLRQGDKVEILDGMFQDMDGEVTLVQNDNTNNPRIKVTILILGRPVYQEYKHYQVTLKKGK